MEMINGYDEWKTTPPRNQEAMILCDSCGTELYIGDYYYQISSSEKICENCLNYCYRREVQENEW